MMLRWEDYFLKKNIEYHKFWENYLKPSRDILFILGKGFDPRMCVGLESILKKGGSGIRDCFLINSIEGEDSPSKDYSHNVDENMEKFNKIVNGKAIVFERTIKMETQEGNRTGPRETAELFKDFSNFEKYSDIIIDISSLPFNIYFPLIGKILYILDTKQSKIRKPNLHVIVAENTIVDRSIKKSELFDRAEFLYGFPGNLDTVSREDEPTIWIPILGEGQDLQIKLIDDKISPQEICLVLPSPSFNPRRGDDLMLEYRSLLINRLDIESRNIIFGAEQNPFELYRQIQRTIDHYRDALNPIGECKFAISSLSSKLMSLGAFLVAYEEGISNKQNVGIVYVESKGYSMKTMDEDSISSNTELFTLWISGDCYE